MGVYTYRRGLFDIYPKKLQFAAYGQFVLVFRKKLYVNSDLKKYLLFEV